MRGFVCGVLLSILSVQHAQAAPPPWIEVKSPHFTVYSNAGKARRAGPPGSSSRYAPRSRNCGRGSRPTAAGRS